MKKILILWFVLCAISSQAQLLPSVLLLSDDTSYRQSQALILLSGYGMVGGNVVDMQFLHKNVYGGHLSDQELDRLVSGSSTLNRAGFAASGGLDFFSFNDTLFDHPNWGMRIGFSSSYHASVSYSRRLFETVYRGNARFAGDTVELGPLAGEYQAWQKFSLGVFNKSTLTSISLALIAGQQMNSLIVQQAGLYTSAIGDTLSLSYTGDYMRSDTLKSGWANGSGLGMAVDADFNLPIAEDKGAISIALRDLGFVAWNQQTEQFRFDSITTWNGVDADHVFDLATDTLDFPNLSDSIHHTTEKKSVVTPLPLSIHVRFSRFFTATDYYEIGVSIWPNRAALPLVYAGMNHYIGKRFVFSERISYGAYGTWGIGAEVQWMPKGSWIFRLGTQHLGGFTMGNAHSRDVSLTIGKAIRKGR